MIPASHRGKHCDWCSFARYPKNRRPARPVEAPTSRFDSQGCPADVHLRPRAEEAGPTSSTRLLQLADVERLPRAKNEIWYQGSETPRSGRRVTRVVSKAARGALEHDSSSPLSSTLCALPAQAIDAAQGQVRSRRTQVVPSFPAGA